MLHINGLPVAATDFATDHCHRVYLIFNLDDRQTMLDCGYDDSDIHPVSELPAVWNRTCPLRFISSADLTQRFVKQCHDATVTYEPLNQSPKAQPAPGAANKRVPPNGPAADGLERRDVRPES